MQKVIDKVDVSGILDKHTGEMLTKPEPVEIGTIAPEIFVGISTLDISKDVSDRLTQPVKMEDIEIKPTGEIYLSHVRYRKMLNDAFGMGNWSLRPLGGFVKTGSVVCREYALYIKGKYAASAIGEQNYIENNAQMTWSDACEATKSNVIMRCCKDLGIGLEMWDKKFVVKFLKDFCVQVWRKPKPNKENKPQWRLKESEPFFDETGIVDPSKKQVSRPEQYTESSVDVPDKPTLPYGGNTVVGILDVTVSTGESADKKTGKMKPWTKYHIKTTDSSNYTTFDKKIAEAGKAAKEGGYGVIITTEQKGQYVNITGIERLPEPESENLPDYSDPVKESRNNEMIEDDIDEADIKF